MAGFMLKATPPLKTCPEPLPKLNKVPPEVAVLGEATKSPEWSMVNTGVLMPFCIIVNGAVPPKV